MAEMIDTAVQEQLDELRDAVRGIRRLLVANGGNPSPAPAASSHSGDAAVLLALEELTDEVRHLRRDGVITEADAERIASCLENHFAIEEELEEPEGKGAKAKGGKAKGENDDEEPAQPPKRRAFFPAPAE